jgi:fluoroacetyl-CoA thioesterase
MAPSCTVTRKTAVERVHTDYEYTARLDYDTAMPSIPLGTRGQKNLLVTTEVAIDFLGPETARVLATPYLIWHLEVTCRETIKPLLEEGHDSVGTEVCVRHLAATPVGMQATFFAEVIEVDGNRVRFRVEARDEKEKIAEGTHERFVVNVARFTTRLQAKLGR